MDKIAQFQQEYPSNESYWRAIILFGRNVASYKFALAASLLELAEQGKTHVSLEELSLPYSKHLCDHLKISDRQGTSAESRFLSACRQYNAQEIGLDELLGITQKLGFNNVLDAFHVVSGSEIPNRFFVKNSGGIVLTDEVFQLGTIPFSQDLSCEIESRWSLVETAWDLKLPTHALKIEYDDSSKLFRIGDNKIRRKDITPARHALNGYQKGKCFYCFDNICVSNGLDNRCDVDHFFPFKLQSYLPGINLNGIWNLVLACPDCNRGMDGKFEKVPNLRYLERLEKRNNFLVNSHHPLRETIIAQTGRTDQERHQFLQEMYNFAKTRLIHSWTAKRELEPAF